MKKIVPFNNVLDFDTDVKEITAISLEHEINTSKDMISGVFYISGEYKITEGLLDTEKFNFELPFDIALSNNYRTESLLVDIDDFRYDLISDKNLKVSIDLYIDGEIEEEFIEEPEPIIINKESLESLNREESSEELPLIEDLLKEEKTFENKITEIKEETEDNSYKEEDIEPKRIDLLKEMLNNTKEKDMEENINNNNENENENINTNNNIFDNQSEETYVTYRVYKVEEHDTIDTILTKYNVTKELLADYNNIENINPGDKLIIPTNEK